MGLECLKGGLMQNNRVVKMSVMPHFNSLFNLPWNTKLGTFTKERMQFVEPHYDNRFRTGPFSRSLGNKCVGYASSTPLLALPTLPKTKPPLGQEPSKSQQQDRQNRCGEHRAQEDQLLGGFAGSPSHHPEEESQIQQQQGKKRVEKVLLFFRATHASTLQSLACISISEVNSIFFR